MWRFWGIHLVGSDIRRVCIVTQSGARRDIHQKHLQLSTKERCRSGRSGRSRKPLYPYGYPGFESLSFRNLNVRNLLIFSGFLSFLEVSKSGQSLNRVLKEGNINGSAAKPGWIVKKLLESKNIFRRLDWSLALLSLGNLLYNNKCLWWLDFPNSVSDTPIYP